MKEIQEPDSSGFVEEFEDMLQEEWRITGIRISSRSNADVCYGDKTVRIPGELMANFFLADPYDMFWIEKEDREIWPWNLPEEKRKKKYYVRIRSYKTVKGKKVYSKWSTAKSVTTKK